MRKYLSEYIEYIEKILENPIKYSDKLSEITANHLVKIQFFQHERIVHLLVTILFALMTLGSMIGFVVTSNVGLFVLTALFILLLIPYIRHYYFLENNTQELYKLYDKLLEAQKNGE